jgi:hypothetical protein
MTEYEIVSEDERPRANNESRYDQIIVEIKAGKTVFIPCDKTDWKTMRSGLDYAARRRGLRLTIRGGSRHQRHGLYTWIRDASR